MNDVIDALDDLTMYHHTSLSFFHEVLALCFFLAKHPQQHDLYSCAVPCTLISAMLLCCL